MSQLALNITRNEFAETAYVISGKADQKVRISTPSRKVIQPTFY